MQDSVWPRRHSVDSSGVRVKNSGSVGPVAAQKPRHLKFLQKHEIAPWDLSKTETVAVDFNYLPKKLSTTDNGFRIEGKTDVPTFRQAAVSYVAFVLAAIVRSCICR
jgi:hypothetical protein